MRTALTALVCLIPCGCFDPAAPADTDADDSGSGTTASAGVTGTATQADGSATTDTPTTTVAGTTTGTSSTTGEASGSSSSSGEVDTSDSSEGETSTGAAVGCGEGLFKGDWPVFGDAEVVDGDRNYQSVEVVDVDGDDSLDLIIADFGNTPENAGTYFYAGDGTGSFAPAIQLPGSDRYVLSVAAGAISDSTVDVIAAVLTPESTFAVRRWRGNGDGTFLNPVDYPDATDFHIDLVDTNGDDRLDLIGSGDDGVLVRLGNAQEGFGMQNAYGGAEAQANVESADLNGDGEVDLVASNGDALLIMLGDGTGTFPAATQYTVDGGVTRVLVGDFDGDGNVDVGGVRDALVTVFPGDGSGDFGAPSELTIQGPATGATVADFDADGCDDIVVLNSSDSVSTILGRDDFEFTDQHVFTFDSGVASPYAMNTGDVDNDGIQDVVVVTAIGVLEGQILLFRSGG